MLVVTPDQMPRLNQLWNAGLSAVECGRELGLVGDDADVREAVLRAVEGVKAYPTIKAKVERSRARRRPARSNVPGGAEALVEQDDDASPFGPSDGFDGSPDEFDLAIPVEQRRTMFALTSTTCHWPVGDPKDPAFFFCGGVTHEDEVYCRAHCRRAYQGHLHRRKKLAA